jgi:hypothetical protein
MCPVHAIKNGEQQAPCSCKLQHPSMLYVTICDMIVITMQHAASTASGYSMQLCAWHSKTGQ